MTKNLRYHFLEKLPAQLPADDVLVSLTPEVSWALEKQGRAYTILEDYYDEQLILKFQQNYFYEQLEWFGCVDDLLKTHLPFASENNLDFARVYYLRLKYLLDDFVLKSKILTCFFEKTNACRVHLTAWEPAPRAEHSIYNYSIAERRSYAPVLEGYCKQHPLVRIQIESIPEKPLPAAADNSIKKSLIYKLLRQGARLGYHAWRYGKFQFKSKKRPPAGRVLFLDAGTQAGDLVIRRMVRQSEGVFFETVEGQWHRVDLWTSPYEKDDGLGADETLTEFVNSCHRAAEALLTDPQSFAFYNQICGFNAAVYFTPYWRHFITQVLPQTYTEIQRHRKFYKKQNIRALFLRDQSTPRAVGALLAAKFEGVARVCLQHGFNAIDFPIHYRTELDSFDFSLVQDDEMRRFFRQISEAGISHPCRVEKAPDYFLSLRKKFRNKSGGRKKVIYLCSKAIWGIRCLNSLVYPYVWYFEFLKKVCDEMARHPDFEFILKLGGDKPWDRASIVSYVKERAYENIRVEYKPFTHYLSQADRVILDFPGTGLYEAVIAGKSVLSLINPGYPLKENAGKIFSPCIRFFKTAEDACGHIRKFLNDDPDHYRAEVPIGTMAGDVFEEILNFSSRSSLAVPQVQQGIPT